MNHPFGDDTAMHNRIREHRERLGWSQEKLAAAAGTSTQQISRLERSERGLDDKWLTRLSAAMNVRKVDLLADALATPGNPTGGGDIVENDRERTLLVVWRNLPPKTQNIVFSAIDEIANGTLIWQIKEDMKRHG